MTDHSLSFQVVSPEKLVLAGTATLMTIPGAEGDFGVLPRHAPLVSVIRPGLMAIYQQDQIIHQIYVGDGFVRVTERECVVLTEECVPVSDLDGNAILGEIQKIQNELAAARTAHEEQSLKKDLSYLEIKISIFKHLQTRIRD